MAIQAIYRGKVFEPLDTTEGLVENQVLEFNDPAITGRHQQPGRNGREAVYRRHADAD
jgi:hypothetical protein